MSNKRGLANSSHLPVLHVYSISGKC